MTITGKEIWEAVKNDTEFIEQGFQYEGSAKVIQDYVENTLLTVIGNMIDKPASIANMIDVKVSYIKHALKTGLISRIVKATPEEAFGFFDASGMLELIEGMLGQVVEIFEPIAKDVSAFLEKYGVSEEFVYEQMKLNPENIAKAIKGTLTIGDVLVSQPATILQMSNN